MIDVENPVCVTVSSEANVDRIYLLELYYVREHSVACKQKAIFSSEALLILKLLHSIIVIILVMLFW